MEEIKGEGEGGNGQMRQGGSLEHPRGGRFREKDRRGEGKMGRKDEGIRRQQGGRKNEEGKEGAEPAIGA